MAEVFIYQLKDSLRLDGLLELQPKLEKPVILGVKRMTIVHQEIEKIDSIEKQREEIALQVKKPTMAQIRYWLRKQEESLLVGSSRTMKPRNNIELKTETSTIAKEIVLPIRGFERISYDWLTLILLFALFLFATIRRPYSKYLGHLFQSLVNSSTALRMFREKNYSLIHGAYRLEAYFYITLSIFAFQVFSYFKTALPFQNFSLYIVCLTGIIGYFVFKRLIYMMIGFVIKGIDETAEYFFNMNNYFRVLGLFLFPIIVFIMFSSLLNPHFFIIFGVFLVLVFYVMSLIRGILILMKKHFSILYLFLYLCTLEILPLLLIYKVVLE